MSAQDWNDERLLEFVLDAESRTDAEERAVRGDARLAARAAELAAFVGDCRAAFAPAADELRARAVTAKVLARTTREDLGWRGDLRLVVGFVVQRLRSSTMLRVAAASLVVHMIAVPSILAYVLIFAPQQPEPLHWRVDVQEHENFEAHDPGRLEPLPGQDTDLDPDELDDPFTDLGPHNAVQWDRYHLRAGAPAPVGGATHPVTRLLERRARALAGEDVDDAPPAAGGALERALLAEHLLDEATRTRRVQALLESTLGSLGSERLEAAALARAEGLGLLSAECARALAAARSAAPDDELIARGLRLGGPLGPAWRSALASALAELALDDPVARGWAAWRR